MAALLVTFVIRFAPSIFFFTIGTAAALLLDCCIACESVAMLVLAVYEYIMYLYIQRVYITVFVSCLFYFICFMYFMLFAAFGKEPFL